MELEWKWTSYSFEYIGSHRKFTKEIITWTLKPPHCLTQKCQKLNQLLSSWTPASKATLNEKPPTMNWSIMIVNIPKGCGKELYVHLATQVWSISLCVYRMIESNGISKCVPYQPSW
jgi:hypothetical protein